MGLFVRVCWVIFATAATLNNPLVGFMWGQSLYPALLVFNTLVAQKQVSHAQVGENWIPLFPVLVLF